MKIKKVTLSCYRSATLKWHGSPKVGVFERFSQDATYRKLITKQEIKLILKKKQQQTYLRRVSHSTSPCCFLQTLCEIKAVAVPSSPLNLYLCGVWVS